ncbi:MAG: DUF177 domain-containing protein [Bacteroidales bacterium]|nr:DUF177 domain-containing protein [Bacteroidales bacterium]
MEIVIPLHGLTRGGQEFEFSLGDDFLERFSRDLIQGLDARADLVAEQKGGWIEIHCKVVGEAKVECDRCLEELQMPIGIDQRLTVRFDAEPGDVVNEDDNIIILREGTSEVDLAQTIYDLICVSLPMQKVHPEGQCSPAALSRLSDEADAKNDAPANTPFSGLKDLLKQKNNKD